MQYSDRSTAGPVAGLLTSRRLAFLTLVFAVLFWSGNFIAGRALGGSIDPVLLNTLRWSICLVLFLPFVGRRLWTNRRAVIREMGLVAMLGATGIAGFHTMVYIALVDTSAINALLMLALSPALILIGASVIAVRFPSRLQVVGSLVSLLGVAAVLSGGRPESLLELRFNRGDLWMLGAVVLWSAYSLLLRRRPRDLPQDVTLASSIVVALGLLIPCMLLISPLSAVTLTPSGWSAVLYIAVFASLVAFLFWSYGVSEIGPEASGQFIHLMPIFGAMLAVVILGERIVLSQGVGAMLVLIGILLVNRRQ